MLPSFVERTIIRQDPDYFIEPDELWEMVARRVIKRHFNPNLFSYLDERGILSLCRFKATVEFRYRPGSKIDKFLTRIKVPTWVKKKKKITINKIDVED